LRNTFVWSHHLCNKLPSCILLSWSSTNMYNLHLIDIQVWVNFLSAFKNHTLQNIFCVVFAFNFKIFLHVIKDLLFFLIGNLKIKISLHQLCFVFNLFKLLTIYFLFYCDFITEHLTVGIVFHFLFIQLNLHFCFFKNFLVIDLSSFLLNLQFLLIKLSLLSL